MTPPSVWLLWRKYWRTAADDQQKSTVGSRLHHLKAGGYQPCDRCTQGFCRRTFGSWRNIVALVAETSQQSIPNWGKFDERRWKARSALCRRLEPTVVLQAKPQTNVQNRPVWHNIRVIESGQGDTVV